MDLDGENKEIVVYYSGHGMPEDQTNESQRVFSTN